MIFVEIVFLCVEIVGRKLKYCFDLFFFDELFDVLIVDGFVLYFEWGNCINDLNSVFFIYLYVLFNLMLLVGKYWERFNCKCL